MALTRMLQRRGTAAQWADVANSVILASGEIGLVVPDPEAISQSPDVGKFKVGDGAKTWSQLSYRFDDAQNQSKYSRLVATQTFEGSQVVTPANASTIPLVVAGKTSQSAHLIEWRDVNGNILGYVGADGLLSTKGATFNANVEMNNHSVSGVKDIDGSALDSYAVNKKYVDQAIAGLKWREPVNLVATSNIALTGSSGSLVIDGHPALTAEHGNGYRILLAAQTTKSEDGIYDYLDAGSGYTLSRSSDSDTYEELIGATVFVLEGTTYGTSSWVQSNHYLTDFGNSTTPPSHWQTWVQFNGANQITAGTGMSKTGNVLNVTAEVGGGLQANADTIQIASGGVTSDMIANGAIVNDDINTDAEIAPSKIAGTAVTQDDTGTVTSTMIANDTILDIDIHSNAAINKDKIAGVAVTQADIQTVTSAMIVNNTIVNSDISLSAGIAQSKIENLTDDLANRSLTSHTHDIGDLADVVITNDVVLGTPKDRQVIKYKGAPINKWVNELPSGGISIGASAPVDAAPGDAWFDSTDGSLYVYYDDGNGTPRTNLVTNPSFETNTTGWSTYLTSISRVSSEFYSGAYSLQVIAAGSGGEISTSLATLAVGETYTASVYVKPESGKSVQLFVSAFSAGGGPPIGGSTSSTITGDGTWQRVSATLTVPENTARVDIRLLNQAGAAQTYYVDAVLLENASSAGSYFDGSTVGASWTGTAHASTSTLAVVGGAGSAQWVQVKANSALEGSILTRMSAVESRSTVLEAANAIRVATQAERDSKFPAPVQGNTVFRADLGYEQKYYAAYNATTNPDGTTGTPGWYEYRGGAPLSQNRFLNADFAINQRGTSATSSSGSFVNDRWINFSLASIAAELANNTFSPGTEPVAGIASEKYLSFWNAGINASTGYASITQKIEDVRTFAGKTITVSFWAKADSGTPNIGASVVQNFGTGGSSNVISSSSVQVMTGGTSWKRYSLTINVPSISGKTIGTSSYLQVLVFTSVGTSVSATGYPAVGAQENTFYFWAMQVEEGPVATPFRRNQPNIQAELAACQRYYQLVGTGGGMFCPGAAYTTTLMRGMITFKVPMRVAPTSFDYPSLGDFSALNYGGSGGSTITSLTMGSQNVDSVFLTAGGTGFTANVPMTLRSSSSAVGIGFSAEL